jgi:hypothetical protein
MHDFTVSPSAKAVWHFLQGVLERDWVIFDMIASLINVAEGLQSTYRKE